MRFRVRRRGGCLGGALGCGISLVVLICFVGIFAIIISSIRSSDIYEMAMDEIRNNEEATALLGESIDSGWWILGSIELSGGSGSADFIIPVNGSRNNGRVRVVGIRENSQWMLNRLDLTVDDQEVPLLTGR